MNTLWQRFKCAAGSLCLRFGYLPRWAITAAPRPVALDIGQWSCEIGDGPWRDAESRALPQTVGLRISGGEVRDLRVWPR